MMNLRHLTHLKLHNKCSDELMEALALSCSKLNIFDAREEGTYTDLGLTQLSRCQELTDIILSNRDMTNNKLLTGKSVAVLLIELAKLCRLVCGPKLMAEAVELIQNFGSWKGYRSLQAGSHCTIVQIRVDQMTNRSLLKEHLIFQIYTEDNLKSAGLG